MPDQATPSPARPSSILARAQRLGAGACVVLLPLVAQVQATAATLTLDYSSVAKYTNSGWFTGTPDESKASGTILPGGFKLWGSETISDSTFWRYDDREGKTVPGYDTTGIAFAWGGKIVGATTYEDQLTAPFDFTVAFTNLGLESYVGVNTRLALGYRDSAYTPAQYSSVPSSNSLNYTSTSMSYSSAGSYHELGNLAVNLQDHDGTEDRYWFAVLTVDWNNEFVSSRYWNGSDYSKLNGDTLTVTIPQNSIDVAYVAANPPSQPPSNSVPDSGSTALLLGVTLCGFAALSRRR